MKTEQDLKDDLVDYFNDRNKVCIMHLQDKIIGWINYELEHAEDCDE